VLFGGLLLAGCTSVADVTGTASHTDLMHLRGELATVQQMAVRARSEAEAARAQADRRTQEQATEVERQTTALNRRLDGLATTVAELSARVDELTGRIETMDRQLRAAPAPAPAPDILAPVEPAPPIPGAVPGPVSPPAPSTAMPAVPAPVPAPPAVAAPRMSDPAPTAPTAPGAPPVAAVPAPAPAIRPSTEALRPTDIYQAAYIDFSKGSYPLAIAGFREFLRRYPDHDLADNAQYWIGEAHFSLARGHLNAGQADKGREELEQAVQEFKKVVANHPRGDKAPTALYKEALALLDLKQPGLAQQRLRYLVDNFPQAEETPLARERLSALQQ